ncbi:MAG: fructosamine kinase family protein, partial [Cyclobacteriaceae bacterium]|nr:fructosamine kinase family protein [Cyclobacteriaceae bacterium]
IGLGILDKSPLSTPMVIGSGSENDVAYLLLEWIEPYERSKTYWENFGQYLALQHRITSSHYGLDHPNHIGRLSQINDRTEDWVQFFIDCRLAPQLQLAYQNQLIDTQFLSKFRRLYPQLPHLIFADTPSLLHGDLWSGNCMAGGGGKPYIFDPAVYFGHREMELAFTLLFGGFDPLFYQSYAAEWPLENGFDERAEIYHLYPLLVHANLFGASYLSGIYQILKKYI